jgi:putative ABC transport system substrate-binding protein
LLQDAARRFNLQIAFRQADSVVELPAALADVAAHDAWYIPPTYIAYLAGPQVIELLRRGRRPAIFSNTADVAAGALISYEQDTSFVWSTAANMMARIVLDGESPSGMPIERPRRFELAVRATASSALGPVAPAVVRRADRVF